MRIFCSLVNGQPRIYSPSAHLLYLLDLDFNQRRVDITGAGVEVRKNLARFLGPADCPKPTRAEEWMRRGESLPISTHDSGQNIMNNALIAGITT